MQKTDLNVSPYYDDFDTTDNFHRVLFRPGFAVQARELTTLQTILQDQIEKFGTHMFKEGAMVIPGQSGFTNEYYAVKLQSTFNSNPVSGYVSDYIGKTITGATSGVKAAVIGFESATTTDPLTLFVKYTATGTDNVSTTFSDNEQIQADGVVGGIVAGSSSAQLQASSATATGSAANVEEGVYFVRGQFVRVTAQRIVLDKYTNTPSYRVGLSITESLITPEVDTDLLDNAAGSSNVNAKGAHRLKITLTLAKLPIGSAEDGDFIELLRVNNGRIQEKTRNTEYSVLGETLARRTFDESGDYTVRPFGVDIRESLDDGLNEGAYASGTTTDDGATASESLMAVQVSPGKAYVRGYEIETSSPLFIDVEKPRTTEEFKGAITPAEVGNFTKVTKVYSSPDLSPAISGEVTEPYRTISLRDEATVTRGQAAGLEIGVARARAFEHRSGEDASNSHLVSSASATTAQFNLYLFDIRMFTKLTLSGIPSGGTTVGAKITGQTSGATGFVHSAANTVIELINTVGSFNTGEKILSTSSTEADEILEDGSNADLTVSSQVVQTFDKVKQVYMDDANVALEDFTADTVLDSSFTLSGTVSTAGSGTTVSGFGTRFVSELRVGDVINIAGVGDRIVASITDDDTLAVTVAPGTATTTVPATRKRVALQDQNKNLLLRKLRKNNIKTLKTDSNQNSSVTSVTLRRQFVVNTTAGGALILTADSNETFNAKSNKDFIISVLDDNSASGVAKGDILNLDSSNLSFSPNGNVLTITNNTQLNSANIKCKVTTTVTRTTAAETPKSSQLASVCIVDNDGIAGGAAYGTSAHHKEISLGVADAYKLYAVLDSEDASTDAVLPQFTFTGQSGAFTKGELIVGGTTGASAIAIPGSSVLCYITQNSREFQSGETITGQTSGSTCTVDVLTDGSKDVTNRFVLDTGQRDNFYDISRITRKGNAVVPTGRLLVVYNYFEHGAGDFFTVDSYSGVDYKDIPTYTATRVDPEVREPSGQFDLRNTIDFRPRVADATMTSATSAQGVATKKVTSMSFNFGSRSFTGTGGHNVLIPKDNSNIGYDFEFFLARVDALFLTSDGQFKISKGTPAEEPSGPKVIENAMKIAELTFPAYMLDIDDAKLTKEDNRRYTMRDIGRLEQRIENVEYYTALNLLEAETQSLEVLDSNGLNRFKSGFLVDNFKGHSTGDVQHPDYRNSMDMELGELRPKYKMKGITLLEENTTDAQRTNDNYQKTGDVITLPYTHKVAVQQPYATRVENLNPVLNFTWTGICKLSPSGDEWFETERVPALVINREGNFDTVFAQNRNAIGTVWNAWQTQWSGTTTQTNTFREHRFINLGQPRGRAIIQRTVTTEQSRQTRQGVNTRVVPRIDRESQGDRVISRALIPFIRARNVSFSVTGMKPLMRVYPFFDKQNVTSLVTPTGGSLGGNLVTSASGAVSGVFRIPNPNKRGNVRFRTGERVFRLTTSATNITNPEPESFAQAIYSATGILNTVQETIIATRNADVIRTAVSDARTITTNTSQRDVVVGWWDPLAQSIMPQAEGGEYLTKIDVFFSQKDENIPVTCQIREMQNGYPTTKVLPFGSKTFEPSQVSVSSDASVPTTFVFDAPVYVKNGVEVAIVLQTDSDKYLAWISRMGELDVGGTRMVSEQPYLGVLFKSQNNSTWTAYDFEDLKFTLYRASFSTGVNGQLTLVNDVLPVKELEFDPLQFFASSTNVKVTHRDHHMYDVDSNVTISGVNSGITTTLSGAISNSATSLNLSSVSSFPSSATSGPIHLKIGDEIMTGTISSATVSSITRAQDGTTAAAHADGATVELYQINNVPLTEINKTHTAISNIGIDSYVITTSTQSDTASTGGGANVTATENAMIDGLQTLVPIVEHPDTSVTAEVRATTGTSPSGSQSSYSTASLNVQNKEVITIGENYYFDNPKLVASQINETNELAGSKSLFLDFNMTSTKENLSPVIDLDRKTVVAFTNRLDNIDSSSDVFPTTDFVGPNEPDGDSNEAIYCTKRVTLQNPATAIKVLHSAVRFSGAEIQVMYKILRSDDASDFDEIGWRFFNTTGGPDTTVNDSTTRDDFIEYEYTQNDLEEFIAFAIKIRMQGTNSSEPPRLKDLRAIALAT